MFHSVEEEDAVTVGPTVFGEIQLPFSREEEVFFLKKKEGHTRELLEEKNQLHLCNMAVLWDEGCDWETVRDAPIRFIPVYFGFQILLSSRI